MNEVQNSIYGSVCSVRVTVSLVGVAVSIFTEQVPLAYDSMS